MSEVLLRDDGPITILAFDAFLASQEDKRGWELIEGRIVAMTNPSRRHGQIVANFGAPLKIAMDRRNCSVYFGDVRIQRSDDPRGISKPRPDLLVDCTASTNVNYVTVPIVVAEVLSPSTIDYDRGEKLRFYKSMPTLVDLILIYQDQIRVEHYARRDIGWELQTLTAATDKLGLESVGFEIALESIYFGVTPGS